MEYNVDEEKIGKVYDPMLMRRLLRYARPFAAYLILCIFLLFIITFLDLARPYLTKVAIDSYIDGMDTPMYISDKSADGIEFQGKVFVRQGTAASKEGQVYQIVKSGNDYYLIKGTLNDPSAIKVTEGSGGIDGFSGTGALVESDSKTYPGIRLTQQDIGTFRSYDIRHVMNIALLLLFITLLSFVLNYIQVYILQYTGQKIIFNMRKELFTHIQNLPISFFDKNPVGRIVTRVTNDMETLNEMYTSVLVNLFKDVFLFAGCIVMMMSLDLRLALVSFTILPLVFLATFIFRNKVRTAYREVRTRLARINSTLQEDISGMRIVQIFNRQKKQYEKFNDINLDYYKANMRQLTIFAVFRPVIDLLYYMSLALVIWYGGGKMLQGVLQFGVLYAFINYIGTLFQPISDMAEKFDIMQSSMAASERIFLLLDQPEEPKFFEKALPGKLLGRIEFKNVWFAYNSDNWVLKDVSFTVNPGETIAFVGHTGAGKSSIMSLIARLYDIQKGEILIDGVNIKDIDPQDLRRHISIVPQDVFLFTGDIKGNITLGNKDISPEKIIEAAKYVNLDRFIGRLPLGYDEPVTERGSTLSQGQRQLISFARAIIRDPDILILDEATSNIDTETEAMIQDALKKITRDRTTIIVAHRLSTIQHADRIFVLHKGRIRESGTHQELLKKGGLYYNLYLLQYSNGDESINAAGR